MPAGGSAVVEVLSAEKVFANGTRALQPIELAIREGEFVTLLGPSGCGKSTLLKLIANLSAPSDGRLRWWRQGFEHVGEPGRRAEIVSECLDLADGANGHVCSIAQQLLLRNSICCARTQALSSGWNCCLLGPDRCASVDASRGILRGVLGLGSGSIRRSSVTLRAAVR